MHHLDVAHVVDGPLPAERLEGAIEDRKVVLLQVARPLDVAVLVHMVPDPLDGVVVVAEALQR